MGRLNGKVAAVTGGASGIGEATARRLAADGARVAICDWDAKRGEAVAADLIATGSEALFVATEVQHEEQVSGFIAHTVARFGTLDILVNNAGVRAYEDITEATEATWDRILGINLKGYAFAAKAAISHMRTAGGGVVVNVASVRSLVAGSKSVQYDTTKAAILGLTRSMARDHASDGVRVCAVGPGPIFTPFHAQRATTLGTSREAYIEAFGADTMLKRPGTSEEVASGIAFLASDDAAFITGTCLYIDGGQTAL